MKTIISLLFSVLPLLSQAVGTVTYTPPTPDKVFGVANPTTGATTVSVSIAANAIPATAVIISPVLGPVTIPTYTVPIPVGTSSVFQSFGYNGDSLTFSLSNPSGTINFTVTATPNGATTACAVPPATPVPPCIGTLSGSL